MVLISGHAPAKLAFVAVLSSSYTSLAFTKNRRAHIAPSSVPYCIKFLFGFCLRHPFPKKTSFLTKSHCPVMPYHTILYKICVGCPAMLPFGYRSSLYPVQRNLFFTIPTLFFRIEILQRTFFSIEIRTVENFTS